MSDQEMERLLKKMVRVLLILLTVALVGIMAVLWQTPIGDVWRQLFLAVFGRVPQFLLVGLGIATGLLIALLLLLRRLTSAGAPKTSSKPRESAVLEVEQPLVLEPLYTRKSQAD